MSKHNSRDRRLARQAGALERLTRSNRNPDDYNVELLKLRVGTGNPKAELKDHPIAIARRAKKQPHGDFSVEVTIDLVD